MSNTLVQLRWIQMLSPSLERFGWTVQNKSAAFRCPLCGDSKSNPRKTRGSFYFIPKPQIFAFKCFNCSASMSLGNFIKQQFPHFYQEYKLEMFKERGGNDWDAVPAQKETVVEKKIVQVSEGALHRLSELADDHPAVRYCKDRLIPKRAFSRIFFTQNFAKSVIELDPEQLTKKMPYDQRIVFLMTDRAGDVVGVQGRAIGESQIRYMTIMFNDDSSKMFGLDLIKPELPVFVNEGVIDSLFLPNSIAVCGGDVNASLLSHLDKKRVYVALDNEPRHRDTIKRMEKAIDDGFRVCFWDVDSGLKDINAMVEAGFTPKDLMIHITRHSLAGPMAKMKLRQWKKI